MAPPLMRAWHPTDAPALLDAYASTPDLAVQFGDADLFTLARAERFIAESLFSSETARNWAIVVDGVAVGNAGASHIDRRHDTAWVYYWLAASARGQGYATRALNTLSQWAFDNGIYRLELGHRTNNPASCSVATRAGFVSEGIERDKLRYGDERFDVELHARLATDPLPEVGVLRILD